MAATATAALTAYDLTQRRHSILRNFPVVGHARYVLEEVGPDLETIILSPAPIFASDAVDFVQRALVVVATGSGQAGPEAWEFEAWTANPVGFDNLMMSGRALERAVVVSGDVHYAYSMVNQVTCPAVGLDTCYIQLVSSGAKNSDWINKQIGFGADLLVS